MRGEERHAGRRRGGGNGVAARVQSTVNVARDAPPRRKD